MLSVFFQILRQITLCAMCKICDPERSGRFILFASPSIWPSSPSSAYLLAEAPRALILYCIATPSPSPHFILSLYDVQTFPLHIFGRGPIFLCPPSLPHNIFFLHVRVLEKLFALSSLLLLEGYAGRRVFAPSSHLPFSSRTWDHFIIFMSVKSRMDGRILQIARTDVVHSRK